MTDILTQIDDAIAEHEGWTEWDGGSPDAAVWRADGGHEDPRPRSIDLESDTLTEWMRFLDRLEAGENPLVRWPGMSVTVEDPLRKWRTIGTINNFSLTQDPLRAGRGTRVVIEFIVTGRTSDGGEFEYEDRTGR